MQTFLSELTFADSVEALDSIRLNKQYLEGWQILNAIALTPAGPRTVKIDGKYPFSSNHPATNMWRGSETVLVAYLSWVKMELNNRGIKFDLIESKINDTVKSMKSGSNDPEWWSDHDERVRIINSHRYNLYNKDKDYYSQYKDSAEKFAQALADTPHDVVCCPGKHAPYWYPTHRS